VWQDNGPCGGGGTGASCVPAYSQSACYGYLLNTRVSTSGHNYTCVNGNCSQCSAYSSCAPGGSGCPWGTVWRDDGVCQ
jgi:hypothetical protein